MNAINPEVVGHLHTHTFHFFLLNYSVAVLYGYNLYPVIMWGAKNVVKDCIRYKLKNEGLLGSDAVKVKVFYYIPSGNKFTKSFIYEGKLKDVIIPSW